MSTMGTTSRLDMIHRFIDEGFAVFPLVAGGKTPAVEHGFKAASTDKAKIDGWFGKRPQLNVGLATGKISGFFAFDADGPRGKMTLAEFVRKHGPLPKTVKSLTPHGAHFFFKWPGYWIPCSVGKLGPGIDIRGDGGYVVGPGSQTPDGAYGFAVGRSLQDVEIAPAPSWLLKLIGRKPALGEPDSAPPSKPPADEMARARAYAEAALQSERERLRKAPAHQRNNTLNVCGFKLGRYVARGLLDPARVAAELSDIAKAIGLEEGEIERTVESGLKAGMRNPAPLPFEKNTLAKSAVRSPSVPSDELTKRLAALGEDDIANAERFVLRHGHKVIYSETGGYLVFDRKRYRPNAHLLCVDLAKDVVTKIANETRFLDGAEARVRRAKFARELEVEVHH